MACCPLSQADEESGGEKAAGRRPREWIWESDSRHRITRVCYLCMLSGDAVDDLAHPALGQTRWDYAGGDPTVSPWREHKAKLDAHEEVRRFGYDLRSPSGKRQYLVIEGRPLFDVAGRFLGYRGLACDETARHEAAQQAQHQALDARERLEAALSASETGTYRWDLQSGVLERDANLNRLLGLAPEAEMASVAAFDLLIHPEDRSRVQAANGQAISEGVSFRQDYRIVLPDGSVRWLADRGRVVCDQDGTPRYMTGACRDVTSRKALERELETAKREAEIASRAKSLFLGHMNHELRTPLNAVIGFSEVLQLDPTGALTETQKEYVSIIHQAGHHLLALVNSVLDLTKVEAERLDLSLEALDLKDAIERCFSLVRARAEQGGLRLHLDLPEELPPLRADELRFKQILLNLLSNAVKFTPPGGAVRLTVAQEGDVACFKISDTGIGMTEEEIEAAQEPFRQIEGTYVRRHEGTGLGLPLAKRLTELHGGSLTVTSAPGEGTTVSVWLPCCSDASQPSDRP